MMKKRSYSAITLPRSLVEEVERIVEEFRYWPRKTDFVREAVMENLERYKELERRRTDRSLRSGGPATLHLT